MISTIDELKELSLFLETEIAQNVFEELKNSCYYYPYHCVDKIMIIKIYQKRNKFYAYGFSSYISVICKIKNKDTQKTFVKLSFLSGSTTTQHTFSTSIFSYKGINELKENGVLYEEKNIGDLSAYLMKCYNDAKIRYEYEQLGWTFKKHHPYCFQSYCKIKKTEESKICRYNGSMDLVPFGNSKDWTNMVQDEVIGNIPLEFVLLLGFASPVLSLLNERYDLGSIVFFLSNKSSSGKTTAAMLASSVFSNPVINKGTLISYNSTDNALIELVSKCNGITLSLDEAAAGNTKNFSKQIYNICAGTSKHRLNGDSSLKKVKFFSSIIISTEEYDILDDNMSEGISARAFELNDQFTKDHENSQNIKKIVSNNYGFAGNNFVQYILKLGYEDIIEDYENIQCNLNSAPEISNLKSHLKERIVSKLALILLTAKLCNNHFAFKFHKKELKKYIIKMICKMQETREDRFIALIKDEVYLNSDKYIINGEPAFGSNNVCGTIKKDNKSTIITISRKELFRIMESNGISKNYYNPILKSLKEDGRLICDSDRNTVKAVLNKGLGEKVTCYRFKIPDDCSNLV